MTTSLLFNDRWKSEASSQVNSCLILASNHCVLFCKRINIRIQTISFHSTYLKLVFLLPLEKKMKILQENCSPREKDRESKTHVSGFDLCGREETCDQLRANHKAQFNWYFPPSIEHPIRMHLPPTRIQISVESRRIFWTSGTFKWKPRSKNHSSQILGNDLSDQDVELICFRPWEKGIILIFCILGILLYTCSVDRSQELCQNGVWRDWFNTCLWGFCLHKSRWSSFNGGWCRQYNLPWFGVASAPVRSLILDFIYFENFDVAFEFSL